MAREGSRLRSKGGEEGDAVLYLLGVSSQQLGRWVEARESLTELVKRYPNSPWVPYARVALGRGGEPDFSVQVGAFVNRGNAAGLAEELRRRGYPAQVREGTLEGKAFHRVRVGSFSRRAEAEETAARLEREGFPGEVVP